MKKRRRKKKEPIFKKIVGRFDIPEDIVFDVPRLIMLDNTELRVENYKAVLEYEETKIMLACKEKCIKVNGEKLSITIITEDEISVKGLVSSIEFT